MSTRTEKMIAIEEVLCNLKRNKAFAKIEFTQSLLDIIENILILLLFEIGLKKDLEETEIDDLIDRCYFSLKMYESDYFSL